MGFPQFPWSSLNFKREIIIAANPEIKIGDENVEPKGLRQRRLWFFYEVGTIDENL